MARKCQDFSLFLEESRMPLIARMALPLFEITPGVPKKGSELRKKKKGVRAKYRHKAEPKGREGVTSKGRVAQIAFSDRCFKFVFCFSQSIEQVEQNFP
jgi:hypothetical protein